LELDFVFSHGVLLEKLSLGVLLKGVEKYPRPTGSQIPSSWISSFFSSVYRLPLLGVDAHSMIFGLSSPLGGSPFLL
jgi:hypothetical protein